MSGRYSGKPFLRLLELYVLDAIGHLKEKDREILDQLTPKLRQTFNATGSWKEIIESEMHFPDNTHDLIVKNWNKNLTIAKDKNITIDPQVYAMSFVDENFIK